ncbi:hypothetical protein [Sphingomonas sp.]|uniref:hypothetical protein n=1 Tax=Sphingomonas sp. TaxID=28214 RepID=UPI003B3BB835
MPVFVACKFRPTDARTFTYTWDGEPLAPGDFVKVPDARSDGWKRVEVVSISDDAPPFACKPIIGKIDPDAEILAAIEAGTTDPKPDALTAPVVEF